MRIVVIGGTGHIGSFLTPRLWEAGHEVTCVSRGLKQPYRKHTAWKRVKHILLDRPEEERSGQFGERIAALNGQVIIDLTCYTLESAQQLVASLQGRIQHLLHCGTIWVHGPSVEVPTSEDAPRTPFGDYGVRKAAIERWLLDEARQRYSLPATLLASRTSRRPRLGPHQSARKLQPWRHSSPSQKGGNCSLPNLGMRRRCIMFTQMMWHKHSNVQLNTAVWRLARAFTLCPPQHLLFADTLSVWPTGLAAA